METIDALIFVQCFVWTALLIGKRSAGIGWLSITFLVLGIIYLMNYSSLEFDMVFPSATIYSLLIAMVFMTTYFQCRILVSAFSERRSHPFIMGILFISLLSCLQYGCHGDPVFSEVSKI